MTKPLDIKFLTLWKQPDGPGTAMIPFSVVAQNVDRHGMGDLTLPGPGREVVWGKDANNNYAELLSPDAPPGGLPNTTIPFMATVGIDYLEQIYKTQKKFYFQRRYTDCGRADDPVAWQVVEGFPDASITQLVRAAGPNVPITAGGQLYTGTISLGFNNSKILRSTLSQIVNAFDENWLSIWALEGLQDCVPGYQGQDQVLFFGGNDDGAAAPGPIWYSLDGGSTVQAITTDPVPFTDVIGVSAGLAFPISQTQFRIVAFGEAIAAVKAQYAYADVSIGATSITVSAWTIVSITDTENVTGITHAIRATPDIYLATYVAGDGRIYRSTNSLVSAPSTALWTGTTQIFRLHQAPDGTIWACGATDTLLKGDCSGFVAKTGPEAQTNYSVAVANDGKTVFLGNDTSIWRSRNVDTGTWDEKKDFGASHHVVDIHIIDGNPEQVLAVVDDATPGAGELWLSLDGGNSWEEYTAPGSPNDGYNMAYFSKNGYYNGNLAWIVGDVDTTAAIHKLSPPSTGVC